jgi:hypothetical protein
MLSLFIPSRRDTKCEFMEETSPEEKAIRLALTLRRDKLI